MNTILEFLMLWIASMQNIVISIVAGLYFSSWWVFGISLVILFALAKIEFFVYFITLCYGFIGYSIGSLFGSTGAMVVLPILFFLAGLGINSSQLEQEQE